MSMIDLMYRPQQNTFGGPIWVDPNSNWYGRHPWQETIGPGLVPDDQRYGPIERPRPEITEETLEELRRLFERNQRDRHVITTDSITIPAPIEAAPAAPEPKPEGVNTEDSFRPGRKLDLD